MSGGHFSYAQYGIEDIAQEIVELVASNNDESIDEWGDRRGRFYRPETIARFIEAIGTLRRAATMVQRIDWLVSGDDGEEQFHERWDREVDGSNEEPGVE